MGKDGLGELSSLMFAAEKAVDIAADGGEDLMADALWLLDPIDGTANYADGSPLCAISLALLRRGRPVLGVVAAPLIGECYMAVEGAGAFRNGAQIQVARREVGDRLVALSDFAFGSKHRNTNRLRIAVIEELVRRSMKLRIHGSVALDLAWLAAGRVSAARSSTSEVRPMGWARRPPLPPCRSCAIPSCP